MSHAPELPFALSVEASSEEQAKPARCALAAGSALTDTQRLDILERLPADLRWDDETERWHFTWSAGKGYHYGYSTKSIRDAIDVIATSDDLPNI
jgi:hypothetical protein